MKKISFGIDYTWIIFFLLIVLLSFILTALVIHEKGTVSAEDFFFPLVGSVLSICGWYSVSRTKIEIKDNKLIIVQRKVKKTIPLEEMEYVLYSSFKYFNSKIKEEDDYLKKEIKEFKKNFSISVNNSGIISEIIASSISKLNKNCTPVLYIKEKSNKRHLINLTPYRDKSIKELLYFLKEKGVLIEVKYKN